MNINLINKLSQNKVIPIIRNQNPNEVISIANALIEGGLDIIEITTENPNIFNGENHSVESVQEV